MMYMIRLRKKKNPNQAHEAVGFILAHSRVDLFWAIDENCDPYACEYRECETFSLLAHGSGCPTLPLSDKIKDFDEIDDEKIDEAYELLSELNDQLWGSLTMSERMYSLIRTDCVDGWENFDDIDYGEVLHGAR